MAFEDLVLRYTDHSRQLLSNNFASRRSKEPKTPDTTVGIDEKEWEGFDEEESETHVDPRRSMGKVPREKDTSRVEKKRRKQDEKQKKEATSQPKASKNTFEALGTADEGRDIADNEEGDGKRKRMIESLFCY